MSVLKKKLPKCLIRYIYYDIIIKSVYDDIVKIIDCAASMPHEFEGSKYFSETKVGHINPIIGKSFIDAEDDKNYEDLIYDIWEEIVYQPYIRKLKFIELRLSANNKLEEIVKMILEPSAAEEKYRSVFKMVCKSKKK
jgi:hypothetical protein